MGALSFILLLSLCTSDLLSIKLSSQSTTGERYFVDSAGRQRIFHGLNAVVKGPPWLPSQDAFNPLTSLVTQDFALMQSLGLNVIRLGTMWPGLEPTQGSYNETYLALVQNITTNAALSGIYTFLDMHQDVLSEKFCGEGVPSWAAYTDQDTLKFPEPLGPAVQSYWDPAQQFPLRSDCNLYSWGSLYFTSATGKAFQSLYQDVDLRNNWANFWKKLAQAFYQRPEILAMEIINEPWAGDADRHPTLLIPGVADRENLQVAYDVIGPAIWSVDPDRLVMFAAVTWDDVVPVGFDHAPGGAENNNRSVFVFHYYNPPQEALLPYFSQRQKDAQKLGVAAMLTEFEDGNFASAQKGNGLLGATFEDVVGEADKQFLSWTSWEFKDFCIHDSSDPYYENVTQWDVYGACKTGYGGNLWFQNGTVNTDHVKHYARSYAYAIAGVGLQMEFDPTTAKFTLIFESNTSIKLPTEIFASQDYYYPNGFSVSITPSFAASWSNPSRNIIYVTASASTKIQVTVTPK